MSTREEIRRLDEERRRIYGFFETLADREFPKVPNFPGVPKQVSAYGLAAKAWEEVRLLRSKPIGRDLAHQIMLFDTPTNALLAHGRQTRHMPGVSPTRVMALYWPDLGLYTVVPKVELGLIEKPFAVGPSELANAAICFDCRIEVAEMVRDLEGLQFPFVL